MAAALPRSNNLRDTWSFIENGVEKILVDELTDSNGLSSAMYMNIYSAIHNFCVRHNFPQPKQLNSVGRVAQLLGADLYNNLDSYLKSHLDTLRGEAEQHTGDALVQYYTKAWDRYTTGARYLNHIFDYLNRHWVKREREEGHKDIYDVNTLCLKRWKTVMFDPLETSLLDAVLSMIERQRNGDVVSTSQIKSVVQSLVSLGFDDNNTKRGDLSVYIQTFEHRFIEATAQFYRNESIAFLAKNSVVEYMKKAIARIDEEVSRLRVYLDPNTERKLMQVCNQELIINHAKAMQEEFPKLLAEDREEDCQRMYNLLCRIPDGLAPIKASLESYVHKQGIETVDKLVAESQGSPVDPRAYVDVLLVVHTKYTALVTRAFENNVDLVRALDDGCRAFVNNNVVAVPPNARQRGSRTAELLARYSDSLLKKSAKNLEDADVDNALTGIMKIFQYVDDKDVFEKYYSRLLSKRLVFGTSASEDAESNMVKKLRDACGFEYTSKLQRMFQDMTTSTELQADFRNRAAPGEADFAAYVLAESFWPLPISKTPFTLPPQLAPTLEKFTGFYSNKHSGRKLMWLWNFSKGELKVNFAKSSRIGYTLQVSAYQMAILLPYNTETTYTYEQLTEITGLSSDVLANSLAFLVKARVLLQSPANESVGSPNSSYSLNFDFKSKKVRINLNLPLKAEQKQETEETETKIEEDRKLFLQAVIVRIMKARKELTHQQLVQETISQSKKRFSPKIPEIKKCIDSLIEKEYLERVDRENTSAYLYLA